jgi:hypothetical protein
VKFFLTQLVQKSRPHLGLGAAFLASVVVHCGLVQLNLSPTPQRVQKNLGHDFSIYIEKNHASATAHPKQPIKIDQKITSAIVENKNSSAEVIAPIETSVAHSKNRTETEFPQESNVHYFAPNEVEMQALPVTNVDLSVLHIQKNPAELQQSLPIQLRLYIDEFGKVAQIERIAMVLPQDEEMANQLEALLKNIEFTPAKRAFADVKSYQEVAFDFKSN